MPSRIATVVATVCLLGVSTPAAAQPTTAQAEVLFRDGKKLMAEGNIAAACEAFEGSYQKDAAISTLANLADCREQNQQYASAWAHFVEVARRARTATDLGELGTIAQQRAAALEAKLSYLIISVPDEAQVEGLVITKNGVVVDAVEWNRDLPVDGGTYEIIGKAPAYEAWSTKVTVENAKDKQSVNVPRFREAMGSTPETVTPEGSTSSFTGKRKVAVGLWVLGVAGLGAGLTFELKSGSTFDDAKASPTNDERHELTDQANKERRIGVALAGAGVLAVGVGTYFWFSGKPKARESISLVPQLGPDRAELVLLGRF